MRPNLLIVLIFIPSFIPSFMPNLVFGQANRARKLYKSGEEKYHSGEYYKAIDIAKSAVMYAESSNDWESVARIRRLLGKAYIAVGETKEASDHYLKAIKLYKTYKINPLELHQTTYEYGIAEIRRGKYDVALEHLLELNISNEKMNEKDGKIKSEELYINIARAYRKLNSFHDAIYFYDKALDTYEQSGNEAMVGVVQNTINSIKYDMLEIGGIKYESPGGVTESPDNIRLAKENSTLKAKIRALQATVGDTESTKQQQLEELKNLQALKSELAKADEEKKQEAMRRLEEQKNFEAQVLDLQKKQLKLDSLSSLSSLTEANQEATRTERQNELDAASKKTYLISLAGLCVVVVLMVFYILTSTRKKNVQLKSHNGQIIMQQAQIEKQKENIEENNVMMTDSLRKIKEGIQYAEHIHSAILPDMNLMQNHLSDFFVLFKPKDIVSGDFYWFVHLDEENMDFIAAIDCTGHGVPGAFMSLIAHSLLNRIVVERRILDPGKVLTDLNLGVHEVLQTRTHKQ